MFVLCGETRLELLSFSPPEAENDESSLVWAGFTLAEVRLDGCYVTDVCVGLFSENIGT